MSGRPVHAATAVSGNGAAPATSSPPLLELRGIHAAYDNINVLRGVDLVVPEGKVVAVLGPNGAGKTTTLRVAAGLHPCSGGDILVAGHRVNGARPDELARLGLCLIPEGRGIFPNLTVRENLWMMSHCRRSLKEIEEAAYERFDRLKDRSGQVAGTLSGGEQQMLAMARGLATDPALLILDELSMGLAPIIVEELYRLVASVAAEGVSILVVEQFARIVMDVADVAAVMLQGRVAQVGPPKELEETLSQAYLGG
jgi:branched-chain amino acid transport system ATP-binding protein